LKKAIQPPNVPQPLPPTLTEKYVLAVYPEELLDIRTTNNRDLEVLIQWQNFHLPRIAGNWWNAFLRNFLNFTLRTR